MRFHLITPVLNGGAFLRHAIASVRAQTWPDWTLSILDAGSTDGSVKVAEAAAAEDARITVAVAPDKGQYDALRRGFDQSDADVLGWLNSDDLLTPWSMQTAAACFEQGGRWVTGQPALWDAHGRQAAVRPLGPAPRWVIRRGWLHDGLLGCLQQESTYFSASLWSGLSRAERDRFAAFRLAGDFYLWTRFAQSASLCVLPSVLGGFRVHDGNRSRINADLYLDEARACGAFMPPAWIAKRLRGAYDRLTALRALQNFRKAAAGLHDAVKAR